MFPVIDKKKTGINLRKIMDIASHNGAKLLCCKFNDK